jgi:hypothetical protein
VLPAAKKPYLLPIPTVGVYLLHGHIAGREEEAVYYIGQSTDIRSRAAAHKASLWLSMRVIVLHELAEKHQNFILELENKYINAALFLNLPLVNGALRPSLILQPEDMEVEIKQLERGLNLLKETR